MLQILNIENVALIDRATLNFDERLNVISGETGAGKSILLDSLSFVFGGRADRSLIRSGANSMKVEAVFSCVNSKQIKLIKDAFGVDGEDELFISRELDLNGKNTCKINGELVPVASVKKICQMLVDVHGQSEHLAILDNDYQLNVIDLFGKIPENLFVSLEEFINEFKENEKQIKLLGGNEQEKQNLIDLFKFQIQEIEGANIQQDEYEKLLEEKKEMSQFEKINENLNMVNNILNKNGYGDGVIEQINLAIRSLQNIENVNEKYNELYSRLKSSLLEIQDISDTINDNLDSIYFDEERFLYVDNRIDFLKTMFRKYGGNYDNLINYYNEISNKLDALLNSDEKYQKLLIEKENILNKINKIQKQLSELRKCAAKNLCVEMEKELKTLGMQNAKMSVEFNKTIEDFTLRGFDRVEFMFSANKGYELKPLNKVVSGGEMSRVMLAYKILLSGIDDIHTIIFDEIDSGLSGNIASVVAEYMARLSLKKQIVAVSHLPQICAMADRNIMVEKYDEKDKTKTKSVVLTDDMLYSEIARLMGATNNEKGISVSKELKEKSNMYKMKIKNN